MPGGLTCSTNGKGAHPACCIEPDQSVTCWGHNSSGQSASPTGTYTRLSVGGGHNCAIRYKDNSVYCWDASVSDGSMDQAGPFTEITSGSGYHCALRPDGSIYCWGDCIEDVCNAP